LLLRFELDQRGVSVSVRIVGRHSVGARGHERTAHGGDDSRPAKSFDCAHSYCGPQHLIDRWQGAKCDGLRFRHPLPQ
jgi:hypothetical protein